jgi:predicted AAA+ superfamily ATPase
MAMLPRPRVIERIDETFRVHSVAALLGPRQCGKTTIARMIARQRPSVYFDLENPIDARRLEAPMRALEKLKDLVIIDEVQRLPKLFELLRVLVDRPDNQARFLLLGSASPYLVKGVSESLAGRIGFTDLSGFDLTEIGAGQHERLWLRGGFPRAYLADDDPTAMLWRDAFIRTFLERDIPQLGITIPAETLRRFWTMIAHYHGQIWNAATFARSMGTSENTARRYLDILAGAYMIRVLPPWFENIRKRQVKAPKVYIRDSGVLHALLQLQTLTDLQGHPKLGSSWEGFAIEQIICALETRDTYFWATHAGAELDLLVMAQGKRFGFELKYADAPARQRSMLIALEDLHLEHLWVVYPGDQTYDLDDRISVIPVTDLTRLTTFIQ